MEHPAVIESKSYPSWKSMMSRCTRPSANNFKYYGGRGIKVCKRWSKFENFYKDMGERPKGMSLDRINNDGDYKPSNCRWATGIEQQNNTRKNCFITFNGVTLTRAQWSRKLGMSYFVIRHRIGRMGWSIEKALTTPYEKKPRKKAKK